MIPERNAAFTVKWKKSEKKYQSFFWPLHPISCRRHAKGWTPGYILSTTNKSPLKNKMLRFTACLNPILVQRVTSSWQATVCVATLFEALVLKLCPMNASVVPPKCNKRQWSQCEVNPVPTKFIHCYEFIRSPKHFCESVQKNSAQVKAKTCLTFKWKEQQLTATLSCLKLPDLHQEQHNNMKDKCDVMQTSNQRHTRLWTVKQALFSS